MISVFHKDTSMDLLKNYSKQPKSDISYGKREDLIKEFYSALEEIKSLNCPDELDKDGNLIIVRDGKPVYDCDQEGKPIQEDGQYKLKKDLNGRPIIKESIHIEEKLRFAICEHRGSTVLPRKALIWVVPDLQTDNGKTESFESAAFQTDDEMFLKVLESILKPK